MSASRDSPTLLSDTPSGPTKKTTSAQVQVRPLSATDSSTDSRNSRLESRENIPEARPSLSDWKFQFLASAISVTSLACLVAVTLRYRDCPISDWPSDIIGINAVVAALTTTLKGSLLTIVASSISQAKWSRFIHPGNSAAQLGELDHIDQASRGPWGSVAYMVRYPFQMSLVTLGAFVTTAALALDLSSQQIVSIETRMVADPSGTARVPWAQTANSSMLNTEAAFYEGFWRNELEDLPVLCSSGNCTWDKIPTIGVCGTCFDISSKLQPNCSEVTAAGPPSLCNYTASQLSFEATIINTIAPNALVTDYANYRQEAPVITSYIGPGNDLELCELLNFTHTRDTICSGAFEVIELDLDQRNDPFDALNPENPRFGNPRFGKPRASLCGFWECLQAITVDVSLGKQSQHIEISPASHHNATDVPVSDTAFYPLHPFAEHPNFNTEGRNFSSDDVPRYNIPLQEKHERGFAAGVVYRGYDSHSLMDRWNVTRDNRTEWIERIAASLTKALRLNYQLPEGTEDPYAGTAFIMEVYFAVQWLWILYPASAVVAGLVLLALNVRNTQTQRRAVWTDSMLVPLLIDVEGELRDAARESSRVSSAALGAAVGGRKVRMELRDDVWVLRGG